MATCGEVVRAVPPPSLEKNQSAQWHDGERQHDAAKSAARDQMLRLSMRPNVRHAPRKAPVLCAKATMLPRPRQHRLPWPYTLIGSGNRTASPRPYAEARSGTPWVRQDAFKRSLSRREAAQLEVGEAASRWSVHAPTSATQG